MSNTLRYKKQSNTEISTSKFLWVNISISLGALFTLVLGQVFLYTDEGYLSSLPANADSISIPIMDTLVGAIFISIFIATYYAVISGLIDDCPQLKRIQIFRSLYFKATNPFTYIRYLLFAFIIWTIIDMTIGYSFLNLPLLFFEYLLPVLILISAIFNISLLMAIKSHKKQSS